jgi:hypothetical protein
MRLYQEYLQSCCVSDYGEGVLMHSKRQPEAMGRLLRVTMLSLHLASKGARSLV